MRNTDTLRVGAEGTEAIGQMGVVVGGFGELLRKAQEQVRTEVQFESGVTSTSEPYVVHNELGDVGWTIVPALCAVCGKDTQASMLAAFCEEVDEQGITWFNYVAHGESEAGSCGARRVGISNVPRETVTDVERGRGDE
jgi:hypothetical protein